MDYIEIKGYKSFKDLKLKLRNINLLIGANGSGKSNFLSFFELLNALYERRLSEYVAMRGRQEKFLFDGPKITDSIYGRIDNGGNRYSFQLKNGDDGFFFLHELIGYTSPMRVIDDDREISTYGREANIRDYNGLRRGDYIKQYLASIKKYHFHDTGRTSPFTKASNINNDKYYLYSNGGNLAAFLYAIQQNAPLSYNRILRVIQSIAPYFNNFYFHPDENGNVRLLWHDKFSETIYGPTDFSDGTIRFIALTTLFLQPTAPKIIIIDEPELGLHPFAIMKLAGLIHSTAQRGTQVIIATQSAELISHFNPADVITVNQVEGSSVLRRLDGESLQQWLDNYSLGDLWQQNILKGGQPR